MCVCVCVSVQSTTGSQGVRISGSNAGYTMFQGSVKGTGYPLHSHVPLHFPYHASPCAITFQLDSSRLRFKCDGTRVETKFHLSAKWTSPFKSAGRGGGQFNRLLAAETCASALVTVVMLDTPCYEVERKTTRYPLHSHVSLSLPLQCVTVCHQVSTELRLVSN